MATIVHVQGGARFNAARCTKQALKDAIASDPSSVFLYATSDLGPQFHDTADNLPDDMEFNVVGPNPYKNRNWYATVSKGVGGKVICV